MIFKSGIITSNVIISVVFYSNVLIVSLKANVNISLQLTCVMAGLGRNARVDSLPLLYPTDKRLTGPAGTTLMRSGC